MEKTKPLSEITAENIIEWRKKRGFSNQKLADLSGLTRQTIHNIEHLVTPTPSVETVMKISDALGVPLDFLVKDNLSPKVKAAFDLVNLYEKQIGYSPATKRSTKRPKDEKKKKA